MNPRNDRMLPTHARRRHNPGNIRYRHDNAWVGQLPTPNNGFVQFTTDWSGYRAVFLLLKTYHDRDHCETVQDFITRWAPPTENNTDHYLQFIFDHYDLPWWHLMQAPADYLTLGIAIMDYESRWFQRKESGIVNAWKSIFKEEKENE